MIIEYKINLCYAALSLFGKQIIYMGKHWICFQSIDHLIINVITADIKPQVLISL